MSTTNWNWSLKDTQSLLVATCVRVRSVRTVYLQLIRPKQEHPFICAFLLLRLTQWKTCQPFFFLLLLYSWALFRFQAVGMWSWQIKMSTETPERQIDICNPFMCRVCSFHFFSCVQMSKFSFDLRTFSVGMRFKQFALVLVSFYSAFTATQKITTNNEQSI